MKEMMSDLEKNKKEKDLYELSSHKGTPNGIKSDIITLLFLKVLGKLVKNLWKK